MVLEAYAPMKSLLVWASRSKQMNTARRLGVGYLSDLRSVGSLLGPLRLLEARGTSVDSDPYEAQTGWEECLAHSEPWDGSPLLAPWSRMSAELFLLPSYQVLWNGLSFG